MKLNPVIKENLTKLELAPGLERLDARGVERLIASLAERRVEMQPPVSDIAPTGSVVGTLDPTLDALPAKVDGRVVFFIRHPGIGWLTFAITPADARRMAHHLLLHASEESGPQN